MFPSDREAQLYPKAPSFLVVAFYDLQGYSGGIQTCLHTGIPRIVLTGYNYEKIISLHK
jgi:hypothetical protein